jgi:hypothetical protein
MRRIYYSTLGTAVPLIGGIMALAAQGCAQKPPSGQAVEHTVRKVPPDAEPSSGNEGPNDKEGFERALNMQLERIDEEIREIQAQVANLKEAAKTQWSATLDELAAKRRAAEAKLDEIRTSTGEAWEHLREGAHKAKEELEQAVKKAANEF